MHNFPYLYSSNCQIFPRRCSVCTALRNLFIHSCQHSGYMLLMLVRYSFDQRLARFLQQQVTNFTKFPVKRQCKQCTCLVIAPKKKKKEEMEKGGSALGRGAPWHWLLSQKESNWRTSLASPAYLLLEAVSSFRCILARKRSIMYILHSAVFLRLYVQCSSVLLLHMDMCQAISTVFCLKVSNFNRVAPRIKIISCKSILKAE